MFPLRTERRTSKLPIMTLMILCFNVVIHIYVHFLSKGGALSVFQQYWLASDELWSSQFHMHLHKTVTAGFLHGDLLHLVGNMWFLWIFAPLVEEHLGKVKFILFYLGVLVLSGVLLTYLSPGKRFIGASGVIFGLGGALFFKFPMERVRSFFWLIRPKFLRLPIMFLLAYDVFYNAMMWYLKWNKEIVSSTSFLSHLLGFFVGIMFIGLLSGFDFSLRRFQIKRTILSGARWLLAELGTGLLLVAFVCILVVVGAFSGELFEKFGISQDHSLSFYLGIGVFLFFVFLVARFIKKWKLRRAIEVSLCCICERESQQKVCNTCHNLIPQKEEKKVVDFFDFLGHIKHDVVELKKEYRSFVRRYFWEELSPSEVTDVYERFQHFQKYVHERMEQEFWALLPGYPEESHLELQGQVLYLQSLSCDIAFESSDDIEVVETTEQALSSYVEGLKELKSRLLELGQV